MIFGLYHNPNETAGLIIDVLKDLQLSFTEVHLYAGEGFPRDTSDLEGLIVMGGPMNVDDCKTYPFLLQEVQLIENLIYEGKPVLGICLGAQLIAKALGSRVYPNKHKEVGWHPIHLTPSGLEDPFFKNLPDTFNVLHWHGDTFDLPEGAARLASSTRCQNQAFRWGKSVYGLQFHFEVTPAMLRNWCLSREGADDIQAAGENADQIMKKTPLMFEKLYPHSKNFFASYFKTAFKSALSVA